MFLRLRKTVPAAVIAFGAAIGVTCYAATPGAGPDSWVNDFSPITASDWNYDRAAHLLERAGFGGTPADIEALAAMTPEQAVRRLVRYQEVKEADLPAFAETGIYPSPNFCRSCTLTATFASITQRYLDKFPADVRAYLLSDDMIGNTPEEKRIARTDKQAVVDQFYYYRAVDVRETNRLAGWLADRMVRTNRPLQEKLVMFWHGHFATGNEKVYDYRKMMGQFAMLREHANGSLRDLLIGIGKDPAMLVYLDNRVNLKGHPNENFAREVMELFSLGVGNYTEQDIKEAARAFTGWTLTDGRNSKIDEELEARRRVYPGSLVNNGEQFVWRPDLHDDGVKTFLGRTGNFKGEDIIDIIVQQPSCSHFMARKLYRFFAREDLPKDYEAKLADDLRTHNFEIGPFLEDMFLSKDFYSPAVYATQIKSPVQLVISTYRKLGLQAAPSFPDFEEMIAGLGQAIFYPPNVKGWDGGASWINPATIFDRGNVARYILFPEEMKVMQFAHMEGSHRLSGDVIHEQMMAQALKGQFSEFPSNGTGGSMMAPDSMKPNSMSKDPLMKGGGAGAETMKLNGEDFNLFRGVFNGAWFAYLKVPPASRRVPQFNLAAMLKDQGVKDAPGVVDALTHRFLRVPIAGKRRETLIAFCASQLGGPQVDYANWNVEKELREVLHLILSAPEYQLS